MNMQEIETFLMIVKTKNISKTAENLFLSQPTVSHRLKALETELNLELVVRKKGYKNVELTAKGEEFVPIAERWLAIWKETQSLYQNKETRLLTLASTDTLSTVIFKELYVELLKEKDPIYLRIRTHQSDEIYNLLEKHEIDVGFVYHQLNYKNIIAEPILQEKMYIVQSDDATIRTASIHTDELSPEKELYFDWETHYSIWHNQNVRHVLRPRIQVDTFELMVNIMQGCKFWMIAPSSIVKRLQEMGGFYVSEIANEVKPPLRTTYIIKHKYPNVTSLKAVMYFEQEVKRYLAEASFD